MQTFYALLGDNEKFKTISPEHMSIKRQSSCRSHNNCSQTSCWLDGGWWCIKLHGTHCIGRASHQKHFFAFPRQNESTEITGCIFNSIVIHFPPSTTHTLCEPETLTLSCCVDRMVGDAGTDRPGRCCRGRTAIYPPSFSPSLVSTPLPRWEPAQ